MLEAVGHDDLMVVAVVLALIICMMMSTDHVEKTKPYMLKMMMPEVDAPRKMQLTC